MDAPTDNQIHTGTLIETNTTVKSSLSVSSTDNNSDLSGSFNDTKRNNNYQSTIGSVNDSYNFIGPSSAPSKFIKRETRDD